MNPFKWLVSKLQRPGARCGRGPRMADAGQRRNEKRDVRENSTPLLSVSERMQKGKSELDKVEKIFRLQVRSKVPGVIDGDTTIPFVLDLRLTWIEVFKALNIDFDPKLHLFKAYGRIITDFSAPIRELYESYKNHRHTYYATVFLREDRDMKKKGSTGRGRKQSTEQQKRGNNINTSSSATKLKQKRQTKTSRPIKSPQKKATTRIPKVVGGGRPIKMRASPSPSSSNDGGNHHRGGGIPDFGDRIVQNPPEMEVGPSQFRFQPTSAFNLLAGLAPNNNGPAQRGLPANLASRDESTMAGEVLLDNEPRVKDSTMQYLESHCSNRDMIQIRNELQCLRSASRYQALNRLIPFTSGILQNAFVDDLNANRNREVNDD